MSKWPIKNLGEVCDFVRGVTYDKADARSEMKSGLIPLLRATNITEKGLLREDFVFVPKSGVRADQKLIFGDALITIASGSASVVGRSVLVEDPGDMTFGAFCGVLRPGPEIIPMYLSHFMSSRSVRVAWSEAAQGTNINNLKRDDILQTECPLPPLEEQKRIVELLDAATARVTELTACYEQARTHANNLYASALRDALESNPDWPVKTLGEICIGIDRQDPAVSGQTEFTYIDLSAVNQMTKQIDDARTLPVNEAPGRARQLVKSGDVLVSTVRPNLNAVALVGSELNGSTASTGFCVLRPNRTIVEPGVLFAWARNQLFIDELTSQAKGASYPAVTDNVVKALEIPVPPLDEQKRIVARLDEMKSKTSEMVAAYDAKLTAAKNLRQSILEAAFAGDL